MNRSKMNHLKKNSEASLDAIHAKKQSIQALQLTVMHVTTGANATVAPRALAAGLYR